MIKSHKESVIVNAETRSPLVKMLLSTSPYVVLERSDYPPKIPVVVLQVETTSPNWLLIEYVLKNKYTQQNGSGLVTI